LEVKESWLLLLLKRLILLLIGLLASIIVESSLPPTTCPFAIARILAGTCPPSHLHLKPPSRRV